MDKGYSTVASTEFAQSKAKCGRGAVGKANVAVMVESIPLEDVATSKTSNQVRYFKAKILETNMLSEINAAMEESTDDRTIVFTDKSTSYVDIADYIRVTCHLKVK